MKPHMPKSALFLAATLSLTLILGFIAAAQEPPEAENLTPRCAVFVLPEVKNIPLLLDQNRSTRFEVKGNAMLTLTCDVPVSQLYLVWDRPPGDWSLIPKGGEKMEMGRYGFLHEYIR